MQIFSAIVALFIGFLMFALFPLGIISGIVLAIVKSSQPDPVKKGKIKYWMIWSFFGPAVILLLTVVIWGFVKTLVGVGK